MTTGVANEIFYRDAINQALAEEMRRDSSVVLYGEDIGRGMGTFRVTHDLQDEFGDSRVRDTPIVEQAIIGSALGAALGGLRPVVEIVFAGMVCCAFDGIFFKLGSWKQLYNCESLPVVVRTPAGAGMSPEHDMSPEGLLIHSPGLIVVAPSTPYDAKGLMKTAIRSDDPVIYLEHMMLYAASGPVPTEEYLVPFGKADIKREGKDVTIVAWSMMVHKSLTAAAELAKEGIEAEVIDLRSLVPLDEEAIINSVKKTGRLVITHEAMERGGAGGEIAAIIADKAFDYLDAPIKRVAAINAVVPRDARLQTVYKPQEQHIIEAVKSIV